MSQNPKEIGVLLFQDVAGEIPRDQVTSGAVVPRVVPRGLHFAESCRSAMRALLRFPSPPSSVQEAKPKLETPPEQEPDRRLLQALPFALCALPYRQLSDCQVTRSARRGIFTQLRVTYSSIRPDLPIAFGADRAVLAWIQTHAIHTGKLDLPLARYFQDYHLTPSGREYRRLESTLVRLEQLRVEIETLSFSEERPSSPHNARPREGRSRIVISGILHRAGRTVELEADFWRYLKSHAVPVPLNLMRRFHARPKAWGLASLLLYRTFVARQSSVIGWNELVDQLGSVDQSPRRLKATLKLVLDEIRGVYPTFSARFLERRRGLLVEPWRLRAAEPLTTSQGRP